MQSQYLRFLGLYPLLRILMKVIKITQPNFYVSYEDTKCFAVEMEPLASFSTSTQKSLYKAQKFQYIVKKGQGFSRPQPGCHQPNSPWTGINLIIKRLVGDIPSGDWKNINIFLQCNVCLLSNSAPSSLVSLKSQILREGNRTYCSLLSAGGVGQFPQN